MANPSTPNGAVPVRTLTGPYMGQTNAYSTAAGDGTLLGIGDFVKLAGTSQLIGDITYADVARAATGDVFVGVVTSVVPATRDSTVYRAASTQRSSTCATIRQFSSKFRRARPARRSPRTILA
jgi:hypothetical protein